MSTSTTDEIKGTFHEVKSCARHGVVEAADRRDKVRHHQVECQNTRAAIKCVRNA